ISKIKKEWKWKAPPQGWYKLNVDDALFKEPRKGGIGSVIRDWNGDVMVALSEILPKVCDVDTIEALVVRKGVCFAVETCFHNVIVESDLVIEDTKVEATFLRAIVFYAYRARSKPCCLL
ncbi:hypothetical protein SO802_026236, partial [Lithocarpus litseifolius]